MPKKTKKKYWHCVNCGYIDIKDGMRITMYRIGDKPVPRWKTPDIEPARITGCPKCKSRAVEEK